MISWIKDICHRIKHYSRLEQDYKDLLDKYSKLKQDNENLLDVYFKLNKEHKRLLARHDNLRTMYNGLLKRSEPWMYIGAHVEKKTNDLLRARLEQWGIPHEDI